MSVVFWYLLLLVPVIAIGYVVWAYRNRAAEREAASRDRYAALVGIPRSPGAAPGAVQREQVAPTPASKPAISAAPATARRERFLTQPETLLYYLLKAGLPDHEIFPRVSLSSVVEVPDSRSPSRPTRQDLDFLICDKNMRAVAAVLLDGQAPGPGADFVSGSLSAAGIRLVKVNPAALPRREQVKSLIFGPST